MFNNKSCGQTDQFLMNIKPHKVLLDINGMKNPLIHEL